MYLNIKRAAVCLLLITVVSCRPKEDNCQPVTAAGYVQHHLVKIPNARVFLKKGSKDSPGTDTNLYDIRVQADAQAYFSIASLGKGDYYLYGVGYDTSIAAPVYGGTPLSVTCEPTGKTYSINVPVVE